MTSVELHKVRRTAEVLLDYVVTEADDRPVPSYRREAVATYRPSRARVRYEMTDHVPGAVIRVKFCGVHVFGPQIKKDGTPGLREALEYFRPGRLDKAPQWLLDLLAHAEAAMTAADAAAGEL